MRTMIEDYLAKMGYVKREKIEDRAKQLVREVLEMEAKRNPPEDFAIALERDQELAEKVSDAYLDALLKERENRNLE